MKVLATGPEGSGTRYLSALLAEAGADALHRSQPEGPDWIDLEAMLEGFDAAVVVIRGRLAHLASLTERIGVKDPDARRRKALGRLGPILGHPKVTLVTYESLGSEVEARHLLVALGLDPSATDRIPYSDANAPRYAGAAVPVGYRIEWWNEEGIHRPHLVANDA